MLLKLGLSVLARADYTQVRDMATDLAGTDDRHTADEKAGAKPMFIPTARIQPASVLARLALAYCVEGSRKRAETELALLRQLYPEAVGHFAGCEGRYVDLLKQLLNESTDWPPKKESSDWPTFGGDPRRGSWPMLRLTLVC